MALIKCSECGNSVSDKAVTCPHCGAPISRAKETAAAGQALTTVQQTSKKLKAELLLAIGLASFGFLLLWLEGSSSQYGAIGGGLAAVGLLWFLITRIRIWWHHH